MRNPEGNDRFPLITVVIAVLNGAGTVRDAVESVTRQRYPHKELIVMDGGSTDGTVETVREYAENLAHFESTPDRGIAHAWNKGLAVAHGIWLLFLGADDYLWNPDVLEKAVPHLRGAEGDDLVVFGEANCSGRDGRLVETYNRGWSRKRFLHFGMNLSHQGVFHQRALFERYGPFDETFRIAADYELLLRWMKNHDPLQVRGLTVSGVRHGGLSSDPAQAMTALREFERARWKNGLGGASLGLRWNMTKAGLKTRLFRTLGAKPTHALIDAYRVTTGRPRKWTRV